MVNPVVERGSTVLFADYESFVGRNGPRYYGRPGTDTHTALKEAVADLEGGRDVTLTSSGLSAVNMTLLAFAEPGTDWRSTHNPLHRSSIGFSSRPVAHPSSDPPATPHAGFENAPKDDSLFLLPNSSQPII